MGLSTLFILLFACHVLAAPFTTKRVSNYDHQYGDSTTTDIAEQPNQLLSQGSVAPATVIAHVDAPLGKRDEIDNWNEDNTDNRIAQWYVCPQHGVFCTVYNARAVWEAFQRGAWYIAHPNEERPRWGGVEFPHPFWLHDYHAPAVDLGRVDLDGRLYMFPLQPGPLGEWPGIEGSPVSGPPGDHRVVFDEDGLFAGVATLYVNEAGGVSLFWCYPMFVDGQRDRGATAEGYPGVDETLEDDYDGRHYLYGPDPMGGSRPPSPP
ncbi:hypothetical protein AAE478_000481 [Parahypoxylon ruwenzoriense]